METLRCITYSIALAAAVLFASSCFQPSVPHGSGVTGALCISLGENGSSARAMVPGILSQVNSIEAILTDSRGASSSATSQGSSASFTDVFPGVCAVTVTAYADADRAVILATGTATVTIESGITASVTVPLALAPSLSGTGSITLPIRFPTNLGISGVSAVFADGAGTVSLIDADYSAGTATLSASSITVGAHIMTIQFLKTGASIGKIYESVNIRSGITTNRWIDSAGNLLTTRVFTGTELYESSSTLAGLVVNGVDLALVSGTYAYSFEAGTSDSVTFIPMGSVEGQSFSYIWTPHGGSPTVDSIRDGTVSAALRTAGSNLLEILVTEPGGETTATYTITVTRSWTVSFDLAGCGFIAPVLVSNGGTVSQPTDPAYTGYAFGGWYADSSYGTAWSFGESGTTVSSDTILYGRMIEKGTTRIAVTLSRAYGSAAATTSSASIMRGESVIIAGILSGETASSWIWYVDGVVQSGATTANFTWNTIISPTESATPEGDHIVSCTASAGGIGYSASVKVTVEPCFIISFAPNGATGGQTPSPVMFLSSAIISSQSTLVRTGYSFVNWNTRADGSGAAYAPGATCSAESNLVLYAQWRISEPVAVSGLKAYARDSNVTLSWTAPTSLADIDHYEISYYSGATSSSLAGMSATGTIPSIAPGTTKYVVAGLANYMQYAFVVSAVYKEPAGSGTAAGAVKTTIYAIPGMGKAEVLAMGSNLMPMSYVPAKTVGVGGDAITGTPGENFYMSRTETTYQLWYDVYRWATHPDRGSNVYTFANAGSQGGGDGISRNDGAVPTNTMPAAYISWRDALAWCNALTEYYNAKNGLAGITALSCAYYADAHYAEPLRSVDSSSIITRMTPGSQDLPYIYYSVTGNTDPAKCTASGFRMPTITEWECAARYIGDFNGDGSITASYECYPQDFPSGADARYDVVSDATDFDGDGEVRYLADVAWYDVNSGHATNLVATRAPNMLGLYDMNGNSYEFSFEWGLDDGELKPILLGSWYWDPGHDSVSVFVRQWTARSNVADKSTIRVVRNAN